MNGANRSYMLMRTRKRPRPPSHGWQCPGCGAQVQYEDYDRALRGAVFVCRGCERPLVIDHAADQPIAAPDPPSPTKRPGHR